MQHQSPLQQLTTHLHGVQLMRTVGEKTDYDIAEELGKLADLCEAALLSPKSKTPIKPSNLHRYTVLGYEQSTGQSLAEVVMAKDSTHAFYKAAEIRDGNFVASIRGRYTEGSWFGFPGESVVESETILEQPEVFAGRNKGEVSANIATLMPFTVLGFRESTGRIFAEVVFARDITQAFYKAAKVREGCYIAAVHGCWEEGPRLGFPGEGVVDSETILEQSDVFGADDDSETISGSPECYVAVAMSTAHLSNKDREILERAARNWDEHVLERKTGFFIKLMTAPSYRDGNLHPGYSDNLRDIICWALDNGYSLIEFDEDADVIDQFDILT